MGRCSGFIAMFATLASRDVDCCLVPESPFYLEGQGGLFEYVEQCFKENGHVLIVLAEGAGQEYVGQSIQAVNGTDASGNRLLLDVGLWLTQQVKRVTEATNTVKLTDRMWTRLLASTNQPSFLQKCEIVQEGVDKETMEAINDMRITSV